MTMTKYVARRILTSPDARGVAMMSECVARMILTSPNARGITMMRMVIVMIESQQPSHGRVWHVSDDASPRNFIGSW